MNFMCYLFKTMFYRFWYTILAIKSLNLSLGIFPDKPPDQKVPGCTHAKFREDKINCRETLYLKIGMQKCHFKLLINL